VLREGTDVTIIAYSIQAVNAIQAAEKLANDGISVEVIDLRSVVPLDIKTVLQSVRKTRRAVVAHEAWTFGGFGAEIASEIQEALFDELEAPVLRVGARTSHIPFAPGLERAVVPAAEEIAAAARRVAGLSRDGVRRAS
jgi:pyruvate/2-oxoglutarate/acetoin dehydrogenase E1 component